MVYKVLNVSDVVDDRLKLEELLNANWNIERVTRLSQSTLQYVLRKVR